MPPVPTIATAQQTGRACPYCRFPLKEGAQIVACDACGAAHHAECWQDNRGCAVMGCGAGPSTRSGEADRAAAVQADSQPTLVTPAAPPAPAPPAPEPGSSSRLILLAAAIVALAVVIGGGLLALALSRGDESKPGTVTQVSTSTSTATTTTETTDAGAGNQGSDGLRYTGASPGFAQAVRSEYWRRGGGDITVTAYSAAKGRDYDIECTAGERVVCTGGTTKSAYITFPGTGGGGSSDEPSGANLSYTGASPGFAEAVRDEWVRRGGGDITVTAYSSANSRRYDIVCAVGSRVVCTGGTTKSAYITFDP